MDLPTLEAVLNGVPIPALLIARDERVVAMNPAARTLLGAGGLGRHHAMILRQPSVQAALGAALHRGVAGQARHVVAGPGQDTVHRVSVTPLPDQTGVICVFEDLSQAEHIGQMRRAFVANVSHELRSPLTAVLGFIDTLKGAARDDPAARDRFLAIMEQEALRMNRLIGDLLNLSRVEAEGRVRPTGRTDLSALLHARLEALYPSAEAAAVRLTLTGAEAPRPIRGDADQLAQVFHNLIENAVKYGGGGGLVAVCVHADSLGQGAAGPAAVRVDVTDHGPGIAPHHVPRLTERFYRVDDHRSREKGGTGLGLAIVKHIVQRHRGRLIVVSTPGQGSTFSVLLPSD